MEPIQVSFQDVPVSEALRDHITARAKKLQRFAPDITHCHAVVRRSESRHEKGNRFVVQVRVTLPGTELNVSHPTRLDHTHEDPFVAARDSFKAMRRRLQDYERRRRGKVKRHSLPAVPKEE